MTLPLRSYENVTMALSAHGQLPLGLLGQPVIFTPFVATSAWTLWTPRAQPHVRSTSNQVSYQIRPANHLQSPRIEHVIPEMGAGLHGFLPCRPVSTCRTRATCSVHLAAPVNQWSDQRSAMCSHRQPAWSQSAAAQTVRPSAGLRSRSLRQSSWAWPMQLQLPALAQARPAHFYAPSSHPAAHLIGWRAHNCKHVLQRVRLQQGSHTRLLLP